MRRKLSQHVPTDAPKVDALHPVQNLSPDPVDHAGLILQRIDRLRRKLRGIQMELELIEEELRKQEEDKKQS